jgi:DNA-binding beta-propeller fold protein YncE
VATGAGAVWVADAASGKVVEVDPRTRTVLHTYAVGGDPLALAVSAGRVWVADGSAQTLRTLFPAPKSKVLNLGATPRTLLAVPGGIWVGVANPGQVVRVTTAQG